jgi:hypothetical protein
VTSEGSAPHTFSGICAQTWALALRHKESFADLRGLAKMRWSTKTSGFHLLPPIVKLADGTWLVGECAGINRHVVGDERAPRERSSDSIPTSSLAWCVARRTAKRRQRHRWAGQLSPEN